MYLIGTIFVLAVLSLLVLGILLKLINLAKRDVHLTELAPKTGKLVKAGEKIIKVLFNSPDHHYAEDGSLVVGGQNLGWLFNLTGRIFFGITPIHEIFKFNVSWSDYVEAVDVGGKKRPPSIAKREEHGCTTFKQYYTHAVEVRGAEMAKESGDEGKDTSTTRTDAVMLITLRITNILKAVFKYPPEGIVFSQINASMAGAFNDHVKDKRWEAFRKEDKLPQDSPFVLDLIEQANAVLKALDIGMEVTVIELRYHDLTISPGNEALEESQTLLLVAQNKGAAEVALATQEKEAARIRGEGKRDALKAVAEVVGDNNIAAYANLELVKDTELRVYGPTNSVPMINTGDEKS